MSFLVLSTDEDGNLSHLVPRCLVDASVCFSSDSNRVSPAYFVCFRPYVATASNCESYSYKLQNINDRLMLVERLFLDSTLSGHKWYKHLVNAPSRTNRYGGMQTPSALMLDFFRGLHLKVALPLGSTLAKTAPALFLNNLLDSEFFKTLLHSLDIFSHPQHKFQFQNHGFIHFRMNRHVLLVPFASIDFVFRNSFSSNFRSSKYSRLASSSIFGSENCNCC